MISGEYCVYQHAISTQAYCLISSSRFHRTRQASFSHQRSFIAVLRPLRHHYACRYTLLCEPRGSSHSLCTRRLQPSPRMETCRPSPSTAGSSVGRGCANSYRTFAGKLDVVVLNLAEYWDRFAYKYLSKKIRRSLFIII